MKIEVSIGEIVDKLSILDIKKNNIYDVVKLSNIKKEYEYLHSIIFIDMNIDETDYNTILDINKRLWDIEDSIRIKESKKEFDDEFIELARLVYKINDIRYKLKMDINFKYNSSFIEEKSY